MLYELKALDEHAQLTLDKGIKLVELAIDPRLATAVLSSL